MDRCLLIFKALSDETRKKILQSLNAGPLSVGEIVECTNLAQPTISHHLNILKQAGVVQTERRGKQIFYTLCCGLNVLDCCSEVFNLFGVCIAAANEREGNK